MSTITAFIGYVILILNLVAIITVIFFKRREPSTRFAWLMVLIFVPVIGFFIYLLFGHTYIRKERLDLSEEATHEVRDYVNSQVDMINAVSELDEGELTYTRLMHMNLIMDRAVLTDDNTLKIYTNGGEKFKDMLEDMRNAKKYIHLLYFIFRADKIGSEIIDLLASKAQEGIEVRVIYDDVGNIKIRDKHFDKVREAGGVVYRYSPLLRSIVSANYRNHRKLVTIDGDVGYIGGMNIGDEYIKGRKKLTPWRDTHIRIAGSAVHFMELLFLEDYTYAAKKEDHVTDMRKYFDMNKAFNGHSLVQIVSSRPSEGGDHIRSAYMKMISMATKYIYIQTPYLVLDKGMFDAIRLAAASGVDVRIMLPMYPDKWFVYYATLQFARRLSKAGAKIYLFNGFLHSKMLVCDDKVLTIGSANMDIRSFNLSFEANAFIYSYTHISAQRDQFITDIASSKKIDEEYFKNISPVKRASMPVFELFSPLL